ncbi:ferritin-like domain-containing protein, partial [Burkholderia gladioli]|nr:ferritin-like domain-containing protein [Burkholderia gladioli]
MAKKGNGTQINIGISDKDRKKIAEGLSKLLADTFSLYLKTHYFHWNVTGPMFNTLHLMFEEQYNELWLAVDSVAERIRTLGVVGVASAVFGGLWAVSGKRDWSGIAGARARHGEVLAQRELAERRLDLAPDSQQDPRPDPRSIETGPSRQEGAVS